MQNLEKKSKLDQSKIDHNIRLIKTMPNVLLQQTMFADAKDRQRVACLEISY